MTVPFAPFDDGEFSGYFGTPATKEDLAAVWHAIEALRRTFAHEANAKRNQAGWTEKRIVDSLDTRLSNIERVAKELRPQMEHGFARLSADIERVTG